MEPNACTNKAFLAQISNQEAQIFYKPVVAYVFITLLCDGALSKFIKKVVLLSLSTISAIMHSWTLDLRSCPPVDDIGNTCHSSLWLLRSW